MKIVSIVGARPQFVKAAPVSRVLRSEFSEILVHTGQHYDDEMSAIFFREMEIPAPDYNLGIGSGPHGWQTGQMLAQIEDVLIDEKPDCVLVYGDTNSTLAGALAAVKLHIPVAHVEAGLRSFNRSMPEEHNRVLTDHCSDLLFCPTKTAIENLAIEGVSKGVFLVGDVMYDAVIQFGELTRKKSNILASLNLKSGEYLLATVHRPYNTDDPERFRRLLEAFGKLDKTLVFPVHPRTREQINANSENDGFLGSANIRMIDPVGYLDMLMLEQNAHMILTDSGGVQKEAYFFAVPCVTLRPETEWVETVEAGWNLLVDADVERIIKAAEERWWPGEMPSPIFGDGQASERILKELKVMG